MSVVQVSRAHVSDRSKSVFRGSEETKPKRVVSVFVVHSTTRTVPSIALKLRLPLVSKGMKCPRKILCVHT